jgi:protein involved in polysaccharide export with SLBB domain
MHHQEQQQRHQSDEKRPGRSALRWCAVGLATVIAAIAVAGCEVAPKARPASEAKAPTTQSAMSIRAGDNVELKFFYAPELNDTQKVAPDGSLMLQLVGPVQAAGKTPAQLANELKEAYAEHLKFPNCTVIVREMLQQKVYVAGEVLQPGLVDLPGSDMGVLEAIMARGGFDMTSAEVGSVIVMRHEDGKRVGYKVNLKDAIAGGSSEHFALQPQDIVYVPRTAIVNVNNFMEQYVAGVIPQTGFTYARTSGNSTIGVDTSR